MISIWEKETFFAPQDVIIAGSGFVGLWAAFYLKKKAPHLKITIIDRGLIPTGASTRNAGFACFGSLSEIMADARHMGMDKTLQLVELRYKGLKRIQKYFGSKTNFDLCGGYELYTGAHTAEVLQKNIAYLNSLLVPVTGTKHTFRLDDKKLSAFRFGSVEHLVKNSVEGYLHPGKLVQALLQSVQSMGVQIFNATGIKSFGKRGDVIEVHTTQPLPFSTRQLLICTNAFANELVPDSGIVPARGQVLLTAPIHNLPWQGAFHFDEGFYYFRNLGNRVLLGGARNKAFEEEETTEMNTSQAVQNSLEVFLKNVILPHFTEPYSIELRWSGIMGMGKGRLPQVKEVEQNIYTALGTGGMGVAIAPVIGQQAADKLLKTKA